MSLQRQLSTEVVCTDDPDFNPVLLCGIDVAYDRETAYVAACVWDNEKRESVECIHSKNEVSTRYLPGFLAFREGPLLLRIMARLSTKPDAFLVDGQGLAHPRRFGLACHFGLAVDRPTIGVAKSLLYGSRVEDKIVDREGVVIGRIITPPAARSFYVSVGHRISLETAARLVDGAIVNGHPAPLREAHLEASRAKTGGPN